MPQIELSPDQIEYLERIESLPVQLAQLVESAHRRSDGQYWLDVSHDDAERFGDILTSRLARVGFDANYEVTEEGRLLEALIDTFLVR